MVSLYNNIIVSLLRNESTTSYKAFRIIIRCLNKVIIYRLKYLTRGVPLRPVFLPIDITRAVDYIIDLSLISIDKILAKY